MMMASMAHRAECDAGVGVLYSRGCFASTEAAAHGAEEHPYPTDIVTTPALKFSIFEQRQIHDGWSAVNSR